MPVRETPRARPRDPEVGTGLVAHTVDTREDRTACTRCVDAHLLAAAQ